MSTAKLTTAAIGILGLTNSYVSAASKTSYYTKFYSNSYDYPSTKVFNDRGWFSYTHISQGATDYPDLHRHYWNSKGVDTEIDKPDLDPPTGYQKIADMEYISDFSVPKPLPPTVFAGYQSTDKSLGTVSIYQGINRQSLKQWSQIQMLYPEETNYQTYFGSSLALDRTDSHHLAVGCPRCNTTVSEGGQVYIYGTREGNQWSQSQVIQLSTAGYSYLGQHVKYHDNVLLASVEMPTLQGYAGFMRGPGKEDAFDLQQLFSTPHGMVSAASVYDETIILANQNATSAGQGAAGAVYVLYPSTERYGLKPPGKPRPVQWSVQQVLVAPTPTANYLFGSAVSIERDTLVVTEVVSNSAYVFKREELNGKWSQQQVLSVTGPRSVYVAGSKIAVGKTGGLDFFSYGANWECLTIALEDHFGDGWDIAELAIKTPDDREDRFALSCEHDNPMIFRYCPNLPSDGGLYSFSITDALKSKFYWEIQYSVYEEGAGVWHKGKWDTKMDFHWDPETLSFSSRKMDRLLKNSTTCEPCKTRPTEKPTPVLRRSLKGGDDGTHSPTVSPAPTLAVSSNLNWRYMTLHATKPWFDSEYHGTEYYISDPQGHRLITSGTICTDETVRSCWVDLPPGDYTLRVGGALNADSSSNTYTYCKQTNEQAAQSQMMFRIRDGDCSIATFASHTAVCNRLLGVTASFALVLNFNLIISGADITSISSAERTVFSAAFASIFPGVQSSDVTLVSATQSGSSVFVNANVRITSASGYNLLDLDQETSFESYIQTHIEDRQTGLSLAVALTSGAMASGFAKSTHVEFVDYRIVDSVETVPLDGLNKEVVSFADEASKDTVTSDSHDASSSETVYIVSEFGYLIAAVGAVLAVGFYAIARSRSPVQHLPTALPTESNHPDSNKGTKVMKELSPSDLKELLNMEKQYLDIMQK